MFNFFFFCRDKLFPALMNSIFRLMPVEIRENNRYAPTHYYQELFRKVPSLNFDDSSNDFKLDNILCWVYVNSLKHLPVLIRHWWSTTDSRLANVVEKITTIFVSPMLCEEELRNPKLRDVENMQIKVYPSAREVVALYTMDDTKLDLSMKLPLNHPLGLVAVEPGKHVGAVANWKNCHMQLSIFLTHEVRVI